MPRLIYISLARFPTEKAHGLQIAQNCEAFAHQGYDVRLWVSSRFNTPALRAVHDLHAHYGVDDNFTIERIPGIDLYPLMRGNQRLERIAFYIQLVTYAVMLLLRLAMTRADVYYSRDEYLIWLLSWFLPPEKLAYEAHLYAQTSRGALLQRSVVRRAGHIIAITQPLAKDLIEERGAPPERVFVAHDGIRAARFASIPAQMVARAQLGWSADAFIVGFVGRLHMLNMDKGVGTLVEALAQLDGVSLALVGGPDESAALLKRKWVAAGLPEANFLYAGQVAADAVPRYMSAFDVCAMPHPNTKQFAYYTSPLKLFEYMASERAIVASDLPGWADVVHHEEHALLVEPANVTALAAAIERLKTDDALRHKLGRQAHRRVLEGYTWSARARAIRQHLERSETKNTRAQAG